MKNSQKYFILIIFIVAINFVLFKIKKPGGEHTSHSSHEMDKEKESKIYYCPMHPNYTSPKPGVCPICGMDLVLKKDESKAESAPSGSIFISTQKQQLIGVKTDTASYVDLSRKIHAKAILDYDERRVYNINTKLDGWIEKLYVNYTGALVERGDPLFTIYSQALVAAEEEYLLALKNREIAISSGISSVESSSNNLVNAAIKRLKYFDISDSEINKLSESREITKTLTIYSPYSGFVIEKMVIEGGRIMPGDMVFKIADISNLWAIADIYEQDIPSIKVGQSANIKLASLPNEEIRGKISYLYPYLENDTRTVKVRIEIPNKDFNLKPQMFANADFNVDIGNKLAIPSSAIIDTGTRSVVIVALPDGYFKPVDVKAGVKGENHVEVLDGISEGDKIVVNATFLIDSESSMKSALSTMEHQH